MNPLWVFDPNKIVIVPTVVVTRVTCDECDETHGWVIAVSFGPWVAGLSFGDIGED